MNVLAPPPVNLENLASLESTSAVELAGDTRRGGARRSTLRVVLPLAAAVGAASWIALATLPGAAGRRRRKRVLGASIGLAIGGVLAGVARWQMQRWFTPEPRYEILGRRGSLELRRYPAIEIAETILDEAWEDALADGFRRLASFLFGENREARALPMTTPVLGSGDKLGFHVAFLLPEGTTPPAPDDWRVRVKTLAARRVAVLRFAGLHDAAVIGARRDELARALVDHGLRPRGDASFAGYDPPWTLPFLRRNELWVEIE